jgi:hypothetical protein
VRPGGPRGVRKYITNEQGLRATLQGLNCRPGKGRDP